MPIIVNDGCHLLLVKDDGSEVRVGKGNRVQYVGKYYSNEKAVLMLQFIGSISESRVQPVYNTSVYTGIYIEPEYVLLDGCWRMIVDNGKQHHLLILDHYDNIHNSNPNYTMESVVTTLIDTSIVTLIAELHAIE
jgi:hypothetical protein